MAAAGDGDGAAAEACAERARAAYATACQLSSTDNGDDLPGLLANWGTGLVALAGLMQVGADGGVNGACEVRAGVYQDASLCQGAQELEHPVPGIPHTSDPRAYSPAFHIPAGLCNKTGHAGGGGAAPEESASFDRADPAPLCALGDAFVAAAEADADGPATLARCAPHLRMGMARRCASTRGTPARAGAGDARMALARA